jgi:dephospho-CoA kinase
MRVIGVSGMPGSGKGVVSRMGHGMGLVIFRMGDVVREEAEKRKEDVGETAVTLRKERGEYVVAKICVEKIILDYAQSGSKDKIYMIEGIRSPYEVEIFKKRFPDFKVISVFSNPKTRFRRLKRRNRSDDSEEFADFQERDRRELGFGIGEVIATSDYLIVNSGPIWRFKNEVKRVLRREIKDRYDKNKI